MRRRTRCGQEDVIPIETCQLTLVLPRTESMPKVEEWCDSMSQHTPELGGLDNDCDDDRLEVMEGSRRETRESQEGDDHLEYRY